MGTHLPCLQSGGPRGGGVCGAAPCRWCLGAGQEVGASEPHFPGSSALHLAAGAVSERVGLIIGDHLPALAASALESLEQLPICTPADRPAEMLTLLLGTDVPASQGS